jgi:hypothetical protein
MAFPEIPTSGGGRILSVASTAGGATNTFPSLSSLTKNAGDLLIAIIVIYDGNSTNAEFSSWGASFTEFVDQAGTATMGIGAAYKWSDGTETGTFTVTSADSSTTDRQMILLSIPGAHASTPPAGGTMATGTSSAANPPDLNPADWDVEDTLWILIGGCGETSTTGSFTGIASTDPTNFTGRFETGISADAVGGVEAAVAFRQNAAASEAGSSWSVDTSNARNAALLIAVRPGLPKQALDIASTMTPAITRVATFFKALDVASTMTPAIVSGRQYSQALAVSSTMAPAVVRLVNKVLAVSSTMDPVIDRMVAKLLAVSSTMTPVVTPVYRAVRTLAVTTTSVLDLLTEFFPGAPDEGGGKSSLLYRRRR